MERERVRVGRRRFSHWKCGLENIGIHAFFFYFCTFYAGRWRWWWRTRMCVAVGVNGTKNGLSDPVQIRLWYWTGLDLNGVTRDFHNMHLLPRG